MIPMGSRIQLLTIEGDGLWQEGLWSDGRWRMANGGVLRLKISCSTDAPNSDLSFPLQMQTKNGKHFFFAN
jgi:hypothetical protein